MCVVDVLVCVLVLYVVLFCWKVGLGVVMWWC